MKNIKIMILLLVSFFVMACANKTLKFKIKDQMKDSFRKESLMRYSEHRILPHLNLNSPHSELGHCHLGKVDHSVKMLSRKILRGPNDKALWNDIGVCYYLKGDLSFAHYFFKLGLKKANSKDYKFKSKIYNNLGLVYLRWNNYEEALLNFKKSIKEDSLSFVPHFNIGQLYLKIGDSSKALAHLNKIPNSLEDDDISISKSFAYILKKEFRKALNILNDLGKKISKRKDVVLYKKYPLIKLGLVGEDDYRYEKIEELNLDNNKIEI